MLKPLGNKRCILSEKDREGWANIENCPSRSMRDNDNYGYKHLIDRITDALGVTDDALRCQLCFASIQTDRIADGTYVIVTPDGLPLWSVSDLLQARHA